MSPVVTLLRALNFSVSEVVGVYDVLPQVLWIKNFGGSRIYCERDSLVPRQHEFSPSQKEWEAVKFKVGKAYGHLVFYVMEHVKKTLC